VTSPSEVMKLDGSPAALDAGAWVSTYGFTNPVYNNYWSPYSNRSNFPPSNATILSVSLIAIAHCSVTRWFQLSIICDVGPSHENRTTITSPSMYMELTAHDHDLLYEFNITAGMASCGALGNWTTNWMTVYFITGQSFGTLLYVDYLGLNYTWVVAGGGGGGGGGAGGGSGTVGPVELPSLTGLIGLVGFIGMVGTPAAAIWFYRQEGGSKLFAGVTAMIGFVVFLGLFLSVIS